ncbi:UMP kinase [Buchnera aphidicola]|uniref:Uridylate kinase n=1 Tax=Buchnera aphidicola subsp. Cinara cedri (strain Cc) TaxID=372461 RepID=PYRH_BUCCC|nr:UMP kinase [Buchnera aphidicola]Q057S9.1 RecName: Full=Uridylate kinase; Short=UK; AltName: Full=Uridine monophosphate kinase; Short=UMP kinase; Short=UMPK [Buchnera aphidicola BCc]ABJ90620.1 uridylate kinase [Buchnera aphidicola BCc]
MKKKIKYNRILLKISGEFLSSKKTFNINTIFITKLIKQIKLLTNLGVQIGLVIGGGNLFRGSDLEKIGMRRSISDKIGMLSTVMNGLLLHEFMQTANIKSKIFSSTLLEGICERYHIDKAIKCLEKKSVAIFCFGLGIPFFTTDSAACIYGTEIKANILLKATKVDGVYSSDPILNKSAILYKNLSYKDILRKELKVMDYTSLILAYENKLPILVFNMYDPEILYKIIIEKSNIGTLIK